ncbi:MAG: hypothetical protein PVJ25_02160, partial [Desulfuromonadales bacterium]
MTKQEKKFQTKKAIDTSGDEVRRLQEENSRLKGLLESHGISWEVESEDFSKAQTHSDQTVLLSTDQKVAL